MEPHIEFETVKLKFDYENVTGSVLNPENLNHFSYNIASAGRGHGMFRFNKKDEQFFVSTDAEVYILDKEYITQKEALKWESGKIAIDDHTIYSPLEAPELSASIEELIDRVDNVDKDKVKLEAPPDQKLVGADLSRKNFKIGARLLGMIKRLTGISAYKSRKKLRNDWKKFREDRILINSSRPLPE